MLTNDERPPSATKTLRLTRSWCLTSFVLVRHQLRPSSLVIRPFVPHLHSLALPARASVTAQVQVFVFQNLTTPQSLL